MKINKFLRNILSLKGRDLKNYIKVNKQKIEIVNNYDLYEISFFLRSNVSFSRLTTVFDNIENYFNLDKKDKNILFFSAVLSGRKNVYDYFYNKGYFNKESFIPDIDNIFFNYSINVYIVDNVKLLVENFKEKEERKLLLEIVSKIKFKNTDYVVLDSIYPDLYEVEKIKEKIAYSLIYKKQYIDQEKLLLLKNIPLLEDTIKQKLNDKNHLINSILFNDLFSFLYDYNNDFFSLQNFEDLILSRFDKTNLYSFTNEVCKNNYGIIFDNFLNYNHEDQKFIFIANFINKVKNILNNKESSLNDRDKMSSIYDMEKVFQKIINYITKNEFLTNDDILKNFSYSNKLFVNNKESLFLFFNKLSGIIEKIEIKKGILHESEVFKLSKRL